MVAFTMTLLLLVRKQCCSNEGALTQAPEAMATYSTVGPPLLPVRIERNMSYEGGVVQTDSHHHIVAMGQHDTSNTVVEASNADFDNMAFQSQSLVLHESSETGPVPTSTSIVNMLLPQSGNDTESFQTDGHESTTSESVTQETVAYLHDTIHGNVAILHDHGILTEENVAYNGQLKVDLLDLGTSHKDASQMVAQNPAYGTDVAIAPEVDTQANLAHGLSESHARMP